MQIKTGAFGADQGLSTGGVFNVITKIGRQRISRRHLRLRPAEELRPRHQEFPVHGPRPERLFGTGCRRRHRRTDHQEPSDVLCGFQPAVSHQQLPDPDLRQEVKGKIKTPFYSGKLSWVVNNNNTATFSTFGDFTKEKGHLFAGSGFGANLASFAGTRETGGHNYAARLNSNIRQNWIGEFSFGLHMQRNNVIPDASQAISRSLTDTFAILRSNGTVAPITQTGIDANAGRTAADIFSAVNSGRTGFIDYVFAPGGSLQSNFVQNGFGLYQNQSRDRWEACGSFSEHHQRPHCKVRF